MSARRLFPMLFVLLLPAKAATAQTPLRFEVVSIHPHASGSGDPSNRQFLPGGRFVATATNARTLIRIALATDDDRMSGAPAWLDREFFDISAVTADRAEPSTPEQFQAVILSILQERFQFRFHREQKEGPVYRLELHKPGVLGPGLKQSADDAKPNMSTNGGGSRAEMRASAVTMADIAAALRRQAGRPVEDGTGTAGRFDFDIEWSPQASEDAPFSSLFSVLQQQLGLRLRPAKGAVETIAIDRVEQPSEN